MTDSRLYVNGELQSDIDIYTSPLPTNNASVIIGRYISSYFNGQIDEVRIYNRALSAEEIQQLYLAGLPNHRQ